jgi:hypothetical protein
MIYTAAIVGIALSLLWRPMRRLLRALMLLILAFIALGLCVGFIGSIMPETQRAEIIRNSDITSLKEAEHRLEKPVRSCFAYNC